jgi:hypothetical protein
MGGIRHVVKHDYSLISVERYESAGMTCFYKRGSNLHQPRSEPITVSKIKAQFSVLACLLVSSTFPAAVTCHPATTHFRQLKY